MSALLSDLKVCGSNIDARALRSEKSKINYKGPYHRRDFAGMRGWRSNVVKAARVQRFADAALGFLALNSVAITPSKPTGRRPTTPPLWVVNDHSNGTPNFQPKVDPLAVGPRTFLRIARRPIVFAIADRCAE